MQWECWHPSHRQEGLPANCTTYFYCLDPDLDKDSQQFHYNKVFSEGLGFNDLYVYGFHGKTIHSLLKC